jgi:hypothetical protein
MQISEAQLKQYKAENMVNSLNSLEVYENDYRLYTFKEQTGMSMFMGDYKYTYRYTYQLFRGTKFIGESNIKSKLVAKGTIKLIGVYR